MCNYHGSGMSVMEMSHRSKVYDRIIKDTEAALRRVMGIPDNYKVLFLQGGATMQFAMVPMNPVSYTHLDVYKRQPLILVLSDDGKQALFLLLRALERHNCFAFRHFMTSSVDSSVTAFLIWKNCIIAHFHQCRVHYNIRFLTFPYLFCEFRIIFA